MAAVNHAARPFTVVGVAAIVVAGVVGAALARRHSQQLVWAMAYLNLVVGVGQYALGAGQARLAARLPTRGTVWAQWGLLNIGHAGVIGGTLYRSFACVAVATVPYVVALLWFAWRVRPGRGSAALLGYRALIVLLLLGSLTGAWLMWLISRGVI